MQRKISSWEDIRGTSVSKGISRPFSASSFKNRRALALAFIYVARGGRFIEQQHSRWPLITTALLLRTPRLSYFSASSRIRGPCFCGADSDQPAYEDLAAISTELC